MCSSDLKGLFEELTPAANCRPSLDPHANRESGYVVSLMTVPEEESVSSGSSRVLATTGNALSDILALRGTATGHAWDTRHFSQWRHEAPVAGAVSSMKGPEA